MSNTRGKRQRDAEELEKNKAAATKKAEKAEKKRKKAEEAQKKKAEELQKKKAMRQVQDKTGQVDGDQASKRPRSSLSLVGSVDANNDAVITPCDF